jgi:hypothetical protein
MAEFIARWFTPSDSDQQSGAQYNAAQQAAAATVKAKEKQAVSPALAGMARAFKKSQTTYGGLLGGDADTSKKVLLGQ